jgi:acetylornithine deacetylase/succinyl-diaminopimelate desuccinylase-like protein
VPLTRDASVVQLFLELVAVPSPSRRERVLGELIGAWLADHGVISEFDDAGAVNGSDCGNLIATVPGGPGAPTYLFVSHIDTVESGTPPVTPHIDGTGVIRSDGETILGADNKAAAAAVMRVCAAAAALPEAARPTVHAAFTCCEESGTICCSGSTAPSRLTGPSPSARSSRARWARPRSSSSSTGAPPTPPPTPRRGSTPSPWRRRSSVR